MSTAVAVPPMEIPNLSSAAGIINLLDESQVEIQCQAVRTLNSIVDYFWPEIADVASRLEHMAYDVKFPERQLTALLLSKMFFHMEKWNESIRFALLAGPLFETENRSIFNQTILTKAVDLYVREKSTGGAAEGALEVLVEGLIKRCLEQGDFKQIIGIALDSCRLDVLQAVLKVAQPAGEYLQFTLGQVLCQASLLDFVQSVLDLLISVAENQADVDYVFICDCLVSTQDSNKCSAVLTDLLQGEEVKSGENKKLLQAYQIAFNLFDASPEFSRKVCSDFEVRSKLLWPNNWAGSPGEQLVTILSGRLPCELSVKFLAKANQTDLMILDRVREVMNVHNSLHHSGIYWSNALMNASSTNDEFLRKNMDFLSYASNWAKFSAAASLGVVHAGHLDAGRTVLAPYLPKPGSTGSPYAEGGALFALGLIHSRASGSCELAYLCEQLSATTQEAVQHGACLGIGAAALATHENELLDHLRGILYADNAVAGEAAALSLGLVMAGSRDEALVTELLAYARETQHDKIVRSLMLSVALINYGALDQADGLVDGLLGERSGMLRFGAVWTLALAHAGTGNSGAVRRLLHAVVSDSDDDVRRAAATALGLVMFRRGEELPGLLAHLASSYSPHVRYGVALALGLALAGTADARALALIRPLWRDTSEFVRQAAYMSTALILQQVSEVACPDVASARKLFDAVALSRYEDPMARFGAVLAMGLIDAGGRNVSLALSAPGAPQHNSLPGICGAMLLCQFWHWHPCIAFAGALAFQPTGMLALDATLKAPVGVEFCSAAPPHLFAYPESLAKANGAAAKKPAAVSTAAVLSTTAKAAARARKNTLNSMDIDSSPSMTIASADLQEEPEKEELPIVEEKPSLPEHALQANFTRITPLQRKHVIFGPDLRFQPVLAPWRPSTFTLVRDTKPNTGSLEYISFEEAKKESEVKKVEEVPAADKPDHQMAQAPESFAEPDI